MVQDAYFVDIAVLIHDVFHDETVSFLEAMLNACHTAVDPFTFCSHGGTK